MTNKTFKILETYRRTSVVPLDSSVAPSAFTFQYGASSATRFNVTWHLLCSIVFNSVFVCSSIHFLAFETSSFVAFSNAFFPATTVSISVCTCIFQVLFRSKIIQIIDKFEAMIQQRIQYPASKTLYKEANDFVEKWTGIVYFVLDKIVVQCIVIVFSILSYTLYFAVDLKEESFYLPLIPLFPFDWKSPITYIIALLLEAPVLYYAPLVLIFELFFVFGICKFMVAFSNDIETELKALKPSSGRSAEIHRNIYKIIELHSFIKQLVTEITDTFKFNFLMYFLWAMLAICDLLLVILTQSKLDISSSVLVNLLWSAYLLIWVLLFLFVLCSMADNVTEQYERTNIYEHCEWYRFPINVQRLLPIIIDNTQATVVFKSYGNIHCTREQYKKVINGGSTYFMLTRPFLR